MERFGAAEEEAPSVAFLLGNGKKLMIDISFADENIRTQPIAAED